jgi:hypothetical protein
MDWKIGVIIVLVLFLGAGYWYHVIKISSMNARMQELKQEVAARETGEQKVREIAGDFLEMSVYGYQVNREAGEQWKERYSGIAENISAKREEDEVYKQKLQSLVEERELEGIEIKR